MRDNMKLSDYLMGVGRPVAYYPKLRRITGSTNATIFICQFIYWTGKEASGDGWIFKTAEDIEEETGLSYYEQKTAREKLVSAKLISEKNVRLEHKMYFKVNLDTLNSLWGTEETNVPERDNPSFGNEETPNSLIGTTETTTENTTENKSALSPENLKKANQTVDRFLENERIAQEKKTSKESWLGRETFNEKERELLDTFVRATGILPTGGAVKDWHETVTEWLSVGIVSSDIVSAWAVATGERGFNVSRPGSLTGTAGMYAGKRRQQPSAMSTLDRINADLAKARR
jgi:hypothetical protein